MGALWEQLQIFKFGATSDADLHLIWKPGKGKEGSLKEGEVSRREGEGGFLSENLAEDGFLKIWTFGTFGGSVDRPSVPRRSLLHQILLWRKVLSTSLTPLGRWTCFLSRIQSIHPLDLHCNLFFCFTNRQLEQYLSSSCIYFLKTFRAKNKPFDRRVGQWSPHLIKTTL